MPMSQLSAFVIMAFAPEFDEVYKDAIKPTIEALGIRCERVDKLKTFNRITDDILNGISEAYFVVAELSHSRANCFYEVGFAHALKKRIIPIVTESESQSIPFDLKDLHFTVYSDIPQLRKHLRERIIKQVLSHNCIPADDDKRRGKYRCCAYRNGRLLAAKIEQLSGSICKVRLQVMATPGAKPLKGNVGFYLHETFTPSSYQIPARENLAELVIKSEGAFTVGVRADGGKTLLELDLMEVPGGSRKFYKN